METAHDDFPILVVALSLINAPKLTTAIMRSNRLISRHHAPPHFHYWPPAETSYYAQRTWNDRRVPFIGSALFMQSDPGLTVCCTCHRAERQFSSLYPCFFSAPTRHRAPIVKNSELIKFSPYVLGKGLVYPCESLNLLSKQDAIRSGTFWVKQYLWINV